LGPKLDCGFFLAYESGHHRTLHSFPTRRSSDLGGGVLMSRIGKKPVAIPSGVTANIDNGALSVKGPKGTLSIGLSDLVSYKLEDGSILVEPANDSKAARSQWGMQRTLASSLVEGVTGGFSEVRGIPGVGYRAQAQGKKLRLQRGFSHDVELGVPEGLDVKTPDHTTVEISGIDKQAV